MCNYNAFRGTYKKLKELYTVDFICFELCFDVLSFLSMGLSWCAKIKSTDLRETHRNRALNNAQNIKITHPAKFLVSTNFTDQNSSRKSTKTAKRPHSWLKSAMNLLRHEKMKLKRNLSIFRVNLRFLQMMYATMAQLYVMVGTLPNRFVYKNIFGGFCP